MPEGSFVDTLLVAGVPAVTLVPLVVEAAKRAGLPTRCAPLAALVAAGVVAAAAELAPLHPELVPLVRWAVATLLLGLGASGAYETARFALRAWGERPDRAG